MMQPNPPYQIVIGLEVHVQLLTRSKLFCGCSTRFGQPPNTQTCPVCIGMPGSLPVLNRRAVELGLKTAAALDCRIAGFSKWDRKHYYYPDLPKAYQISQFDLPLGTEGFLTIPLQQRRIRIIRVHLEEDAGKSMHDEDAGTADSRIDLNRTGTPLLEIVSHPDLRGPAEAKAYLTELKLLLTYLGVSDCNMQEGNLRVDANVNLHIDTPEGIVATPIIEVKNMNSFRAVERAMTHEPTRLWDEWCREGRRLGEVPKQTRGWDDAAQVTRAQRSKEESSDYRYLPDPDLVPVTVSPSQIDALRDSLGERPAAIRQRLETTHAVSPQDADVLVSQGREMVDYFVALADACGDSKAASNWIQQDVLRYLNEQGVDVADYPVDAERLAALIRLTVSGKLSTSRGREVLAEMIASDSPVDRAMAALGIAEVDASALEALCRELLEANPRIVAQVQEGKTKAAGALIGMARQKNPNVNPNQVRQLCLELISRM